MLSDIQRCVSLGVTADGEALQGEVRAANGAFDVFVGGTLKGEPSKYESAIGRMARSLRAGLPPAAPSDWRVTVRREPQGVVAEFAPGGLQALTTVENECIQRVLSYCPCATLSDALEAASQLLIHCFGPPAARS